MYWTRDIGLRWKLLGCVSIVVLLMGGAAGWTVYQLQRQETSYTHLVEGEDGASEAGQCQMRILAALVAGAVAVWDGDGMKPDDDGQFCRGRSGRVPYQREFRPGSSAGRPGQADPDKR